MFTESQWKEIRRREGDFRKLYSGEGCDYVLSWYFNAALDMQRPDYLITENDRDKWLQNELRAVKENTREALDSTSLFYPMVEMFSYYGTHFLDKLFGAEVGLYSGQFWSEVVDYPVSDLQMPDVDNSPVLKEAVELAQWIKKQSPEGFLISMPDVGCPLNIAINLFGDKFLLEMAANPKSAKRALDIVGDVTRRVIEVFCEAVGQQTIRSHNSYYLYTPYDYGGLSLCATQMVSPSNFDDLIATAEAACMPSSYKGMVQHICGKSSQHVAGLAKMPSVKGIQLNDIATEDFAAYYNGLRSDQIFYVRLTPIKLDEVLATSGGDRTIIIIIEAQDTINERIPVERKN